MADLQLMGEKAVAAKYALQKLTTAEKNAALEKAAAALLAEQDTILAENEKDLKKGEANGMPVGLLDRLRLTEDRIAAMAAEPTATPITFWPEEMSWMILKKN